MITDYGRVIGNIQSALCKKIKNDNIKSLVLGISGGIDSGISAALSYPVCEVMKIPLIGRSITIESNSKEEINRSRAVGTALCHDFQYINMSSLYVNMENVFGMLHTAHRDKVPRKCTLEYKIAMGNVKARLRMIYLYHLAGTSKGMVLSTDNYTELLAGFWTLHGDVGDYGMIQNLWKTEVYEMAKWMIENNYDSIFHSIDHKQLLAMKPCIDATPTDGLGITSSDLEQLGVNSYPEADQIFINFFGGDVSLAKHPLIKRFKATKHKRENPYSIPRETLLE